MRKAIKIGLPVAFAVIGVAAWLVWGKAEEPPEWSGFFEVQQVLNPQPDPPARPGMGVPANPLPEEFREAYMNPLREALLSPDPEGALIGVLRQAAMVQIPRQDATIPFEQWQNQASIAWAQRQAGHGAVCLLGGGGVGHQRAATSLREAYDSGYRILPDGTTGGIWVCPICGSESDLTLENNLWMVDNLNSLSPQHQVSRIADEVERIIASDLPIRTKRSRADMVVGRLADLGLKEGLPVLWRIREANAAYFERGKQDPSQIARPENWFPVDPAIRLIAKLDDPAALDLLEPLTHPYHFAGATGPGGAQSVGNLWWRLKFKTVPQQQWPQLIGDAVRNSYIGAQPKTPTIALDGIEEAAEVAGPACLPLVREIAFDPNLPPVTKVRRSGNRPPEFYETVERELAETPHFFALKVLGKLRDAESLPTLRQLALDPAQFELYRMNLIHCIGQIGSEGPRDVLFEIAQQALKLAHVNILRSCLGELAPWPSTMPPPTADQVAFLEGLRGDSPAAKTAAHILSSLRTRGVIP